MKGKLKLGRLAEAPVFVHWTALLAAAGVAYTQTDDPWVGLALGVTWLLALLTHQAAQARVARMTGLNTREITLLPFGSLTRLDRLPVHPLQEAATVMAGPLCLLGLAGLFSLVAQLLHNPWVAIGGRLFMILGAVNLLPAFPLDGGRALRAWLGRNQTLEQATRTACRVGQAVAVLCVVAAIGWTWAPPALLAAYLWLGSKVEKDLVDREQRSFFGGYLPPPMEVLQAGQLAQLLWLLTRVRR